MACARGRLLPASSVAAEKVGRTQAAALAAHLHDERQSQTAWERVGASVVSRREVGERESRPRLRCFDLDGDRRDL
jgi:hypothetical protein